MSNQATTTGRQPIVAPNLNPTPKERFRSSPNNISEHRALVESRPFDRAIDFAKAQYSLDLAKGCRDNNTALANGWKIQGMEEFCSILKTLSEHVTYAAPVPTDNLGSNLS